MPRDHESLSIELGESSVRRCACCGNDSVTVHGYLYDSTGDTAVYLAGFTVGHGDGRANVLVSPGPWGEGTSPGARTSIAFEAVVVGNALMLELADPASSPWPLDSAMGQVQHPASISKAHAERSSRLARQACEKDPRVGAALRKGAGGIAPEDGGAPR